MAKNVVNRNCTFKCGVGSVTPEGFVGTEIQCSLQLISPSENSFKMKPGVEVLAGTIQVQVTGVSYPSTSPTFVQSSPGVVNILGSSQKVKSSNQPVLLELDNGTVILSGNNPQASGAPVTLSVCVWVDDAGQDKVKAN